jgi:hypothetical protein
MTHYLDLVLGHRAKERIPMTRTSYRLTRITIPAENGYNDGGPFRKAARDLVQ